MNSKEFGIERYIDLARAQTKAEGPPGLPGEQSPGPAVMYADRVAWSASAGEELVVSEYTILGNTIEERDSVYVEWGGGVVADPVGYTGVVAKIYWNSTLIATITPTALSVVYTTSLTEIITNYMAVTTFGPGTPRTSQYSSVYMPNWRQNNGTVMVTVTPTIDRAYGMLVRIIRVKQ